MIITTKPCTKGENCTMVNYNTTNSNLTRGICNFSKKISKGLKRPILKFVSDMVYGILASGSSLITEIARNLNENIPLIKTVNRLCRNLQDFSDEEKSIVEENYLSSIKSSYDDKSVIVIDGSDITKPASKKLEALCKVRDGSTGEIGIGYHTIGAAVLSKEKKLPFGVYSRVYSSEEADFVSEDQEMLDCFKFLSGHFKKSNIRTMDRGFDNNRYYEYFIKNKENFIIRAKKNRNVIYNGKTQNILDVANMFKGKYALKFKNKDGKKVDVKISIIPIELCEFKGTPLNLVVVHGFGELPMMLITSLSSDDKNICVDVCKVYLMRWRIEEYFKFKKQSFDYENLRVRSLQSIRTLDFLLTMAIGYVSKLSDKDDTVILRFEIISVSKRLFDIADFLYYAVADGIFEVLKFVKRSISSFLVPPPNDGQLRFAPWAA